MITRSKLKKVSLELSVLILIIVTGIQWSFFSFSFTSDLEHQPIHEIQSHGPDFEILYEIVNHTRFDPYSEFSIDFYIFDAINQTIIFELNGEFLYQQDIINDPTTICLNFSFLVEGDYIIAIYNVPVGFDGILSSENRYSQLFFSVAPRQINYTLILGIIVGVLASLIAGVAFFDKIKNLIKKPGKVKITGKEIFASHLKAGGPGKPQFFSSMGMNSAKNLRTERLGFAPFKRIGLKFTVILLNRQIRSDPQYMKMKKFLRKI